MSSKRIFNFGAGPSTLPLEVIETLREDLLSYQGSGIGVAELSHRSKHFENIITEAESDLRLILGISEDYHVLFAGSGASLQFSMVPMNLYRKGTQANYIVSGFWAELAAEEAKKFSALHIAASSKSEGYNSLPKDLKLSSKPCYLHFTSNNTLYGTQFKTEPDVGSVPLVCDASSDILHKPLDISKYALIYAGAQKNVGISGCTIIIVRKELLQQIPKDLPALLSYNTYAQNKSLYNTPATVPIYVVGLMLKRIKQLGGLGEIYKINQQKAKIFYDTLDKLEFYRTSIEPEARSLMNVTFKLPSIELEDKFLSEAEHAGFVGLKGHRIVGGIRASIYNAFPIEGVKEFTKFMTDFACCN